MKSNKLVKKYTNLNEVAEGLGGSSGGGENIINPRELQHLLGNPSRHDLSSPVVRSAPAGRLSDEAGRLADGAA